jgi:hypothetical protein
LGGVLMAQRPTSLAEVTALELDGRAAAGRPPDIMWSKQGRGPTRATLRCCESIPTKRRPNRQLSAAYEPYFRKLNHRLDQFARAS